MELMRFLNAYEDWERILATPPYSLKVSCDGDYRMLKYQQFVSDMTLRIVQEARGVVVRRHPLLGIWVPVSIGMFKFFNYGEPEAATLDWDNVVVTEKVDGSIVKVVWDSIAAQWLVSTNGTIDAAKANCADGVSFLEAFEEQLGDNKQLFFESLKKNYTYFFELVSPHNPICVHYGKEQFGFYFLGCRNMETLEEERLNLPPYGSKLPRQYALVSIDDCVACAQALGENNEGFVACDKNWNRIKIKTPWYIAMHKMRGNGVMTVKRVIEMWQQEVLDDFVATFPEYRDYVEEIVGIVNTWMRAGDEIWNQFLNSDALVSRKVFAAEVQRTDKIFWPYLFARLDNKVKDATDYFFHLRPKQLANEIVKITHKETMGVESDE